MTKFSDGVAASDIKKHIFIVSINKELLEKFKMCCLESKTHMNLIIVLSIQQYINGTLHLERDAILRWKMDQGEQENFSLVCNNDVRLTFKKKCKNEGYFVKYVLMALIERYVSKRDMLIY